MIPLRRLQIHNALFENTIGYIFKIRYETSSKYLKKGLIMLIKHHNYYYINDA